MCTVATGCLMLHCIWKFVLRIDISVYKRFVHKAVLLIHHGQGFNSWISKDEWQS